ncbi:hypothetical protein PCASD_03700 [Puccinia coronata f. sp. avenae]|uniref:Uncharacterized protein n=1 Tax=Puccinia coronata f. sp. avenae TaxID=200324 RepID=A0A2N5V9H4_9BASI|nr:hypothetical protein PCASD_03700 [Puccinia coronata f. sp. avenae]
MPKTTKSPVSMKEAVTIPVFMEELAAAVRVFLALCLPLVQDLAENLLVQSESE